MSLISSILIDIFGNRNLLIVSGAGMAVSLSLLNVAYDTEIIDHDEKWLFILICVYMVFYSVGYGPVPWILMPKICPRKVIQ